MKARNAPETRLQKNSIPVLTSPIPSIPSIVPPSHQTGTSRESENQDSEIRELAYKLYEERGRAEGQALQDWFDAEVIVRQGGKVAA
jgi:hypothetical protein